MANRSTLAVVVQARDELSGAFDQMSKKVKSHALAIGAAMTGVGAAGLKLTDDSRKLTAGLNVTALTLGTNTDALRSLALETTNVSFPMEEVTKTFDLLAKAGVRDNETLAKTATAFDTLGDAIGKNASDVTSLMVPAMKTFGLSFDEISAKTDLFTYLSKNSTLTLDDFNSMVGKVTPAMVEQGLSVEELTKALIVLEKQGYAPGEVLSREFEKAANRVKEEHISLAEALGITSEELEEVQVGLDGAVGMTQEYADAANYQYGIVDKVKQKFNELKVQYGAILEPFEAVFAGLTAMGPVMMALSTNIGKATIKWIAHTAAWAAHAVIVGAVKVATIAYTAAQWALNAAMIANPVGLLIAALGGLVALAVTLTGSWGKVADFFKGLWDKISGFFKDNWEKILMIILPVPMLLISNWESITGFFADLWKGVVGVFRFAWDAIAGILQKAWDFMTAGFKSTINGILTVVEFWVNTFIKGINLIISALNTIHVSIPSWVPGLGGKGFGIDLPHISEISLPRLAEGGLVMRPTLAMIGEQGPEAIIPLKQSGGGMVENHVHVYLNGDEVSDLVVERISSELRMQGAFA